MAKSTQLLANVSVVQGSKKYPLLNNKTTYYVCRNHSCLPPVDKLRLNKA